MRLSIALIATFIVSACVSSTHWQTPRVTVVGASMVSADVFSQQFRVRVHVHNPNTLDLPVKRLEYKLWLEGDSFAEGSVEAPFVVPAKGDQEFDLALNTNYISSIGRLIAHLTGTNRHTIQYNLEGTVVIDASFSPKIKFNEVGMVDLDRL